MNEPPRRPPASAPPTSERRRRPGGLARRRRDQRRQQVIEVLVAVGSHDATILDSPTVIAALVEEMAGDHSDGDRIAALQDATADGPGLRLDDRFPNCGAPPSRDQRQFLKGQPERG